MLHLIRRAYSRRSDSGAALVVVMGYAAVLMVVMSLLAAYALNSMKGARREQDYYSAIEAAQSGVDDVIASFNVNPALATPSAAWSSWRSVSGAKDAGGASCAATSPAATCAQYAYRVEADPSSTKAGAVVIRVVGKSRAVSRAVKVATAPRGLTDYLYYSDVEAYDPSDDLVPGLVSDVLTYHRDNCAQRAWAGLRPSDCNEPKFQAGDTLSGSGRVHSNDALLLKGNPDFAADVTTALPSCATKVTDASCYHVPQGQSASPRFGPGGIAYEPAFNMPSDSSVLSAVKNDPGTCVYTGPTRIEFHDDEMWVWSPRTATTVSAGGLNCGGGVPSNLVGTLGATLGSVTGGLIDLGTVGTQHVVHGIPKAIYVKDAPALTNPLQCRLNQLLGVSSGTLDVSVNDGCTEGTLLVSGRLDGRTTAATEHDIVIVDDLTYKTPPANSGADDMLGLIAKDNVELYNPLQCTVALTTGCLSSGLIPGVLNLANYLFGSDDFEVDAAIVALNGRFGVQLSNLVPTLSGLTGLHPKLKLRGSVAQRYAGYVGGPLTLNVAGLTPGVTLNMLPTGFQKDYVYDERLASSAPDFFPKPANAPYDRYAFAEVDVPTVS